MENYEFKMTNYPEGIPSSQGPLCGGTKWHTELFAVLKGL